MAGERWYARRREAERSTPDQWQTEQRLASERREPVQTRNNETDRTVIADGYIDDNVSVVRRAYVVHETLERAVTSTITPIERLDSSNWSIERHRVVTLDEPLPNPVDRFAVEASKRRWWTYGKGRITKASVRVGRKSIDAWSSERRKRDPGKFSIVQTIYTARYWRDFRSETSREKLMIRTLHARVRRIFFFYLTPFLRARCPLKLAKSPFRLVPRRYGKNHVRSQFGRKITTRRTGSGIAEKNSYFRFPTRRPREKSSATIVRLSFTL